jgi:Eukaryotic aspartyl protease
MAVGYSVELQIGRKGTFKLLIDTGANDLWVASSMCRSCYDLVCTLCSKTQVGPEDTTLKSDDFVDAQAYYYIHLQIDISWYRHTHAADNSIRNTLRPSDFNFSIPIETRFKITSRRISRLSDAIITTSHSREVYHPE